MIETIALWSGLSNADTIGSFVNVTILLSVVYMGVWFLGLFASLMIESFFGK